MKFYFLSLMAILPFLVNAQVLNPSSNTSFCNNGNLTVTGAPAGTTYQWQVGGTDISGATNNIYNVTASGSYRVILQEGSNRDTLGPVTITINPNPVSSFTNSTASGCMNTPVQFTFTGSGTGLTYIWDFDDPLSTGNTSTQANPTHRFVGIPGNGTQTFVVRLTVINSNGCTSTFTRSITLNQQPSTSLNGTGRTDYNNFTYFTECTQNSAAFDFINTSTTTATNTNYEIVWGDGSPNFTSTGFVSQNHSYTSGLYNLLFIVTGDNGCKDTTNYRVFVGTNPAIGFGTPGSSAICNDEELTFQISGFAGNPPSTLYTVLFNDGTPPINYSHPPPVSVSHIFDTTSCGTTSGAFSNSFSATIEAHNACSRSVVQVVPIYVSEKPDPDFTISPNDTVCVNNIVTINNTGSVASYNNNGTCTPGNFVWKITPATGFTVVSGTLGNDFGSPNSGIWITGTNTLQLNFTSPGTYSIELLVGNPKCGNASVVQNICVTPEPTGSFTVNNNEGCAPFNITTNLTNNTPTCGNMLYSWNVGYSAASGCTQTTAAYTFIGGTSASSQSPQIRFTNPGVYTLTPTIIAPGASCSTTLAPQQIIVKDKPVVSIGALPPSVCIGESVAVSGTANCYIDASTTYAWTFAGATPTTASTINPGSITFNTIGASAIGLSVTNSCGTSTANSSINVLPTPVINTLSNLSFCAGSPSGSIPFSATPNAGVTFSWTNTNTAIGLASSGNGNISSFVATNSGTTPITATITVRATLGTCFSTETFTITVNPTPATLVTAPVSYCVGETATALTATPSAGNQLLWYTTAIGGTGSTTAPVPSTTTPGTTTYFVSQLNTTTNCESSRTPIVVTINPIPVIATVVGLNPTQCATANGTINLTGLIANTTYTVTYTSSTGNHNVSIVSSNTGVIAITGLTAGSYSNIRVARNGCSSDPAGPISLSDPSAPAAPTVSSNAPLCSGQNLTLQASNVSGGSYAWTGPNGFNSTIRNPTISAATVSASGTYSVTVTVSGCTSPAGTIDVLINPTPLVSISGNTPVCTGETLSLSSAVTYSGTVTYDWTGPGSFSSTDANPTIPNVQISSEGTYFLTVTGSAGNCPSTQTSVAMVVNPTPVISNITSTNPTLCSTPTGTIRISGLTAGVTYDVQYTRNTIPQNATITANGSGVVIITGLLAGVYSDFEITLNGCSATDPTVITLSDPNPPAAPTAGSNAPLCTGNTINLTASPNVPGGTFSWTGPNGFTSTLQNPTITNATLSHNGDYHVTVTVSGCTSAPGTVSVVVNETPATPTLTSNSPICNGNTLQLNASTTFTGALTYSWVGPNAFTANIIDPEITNAQPINSGTYTLIITAVTGTCVAQPASVNAIIHQTPIIASATGINPNQCSTPTGSITLTGLQPSVSFNVSYQFNTMPVTQTIASNGSGSLIIPTLLAGTYSNIVVEVNGCSSVPATTIVLEDPNPPSPPVLTQNGPICTNETIQLNASTTEPGTASYIWTGPNAYSGTTASFQITNATAVNAGTYFATVTIDNCTSAPSNITVVVNPLPAQPSVISPVELCINTVATPLSATPAAGNTLNWYLNANQTNPVSPAPTPSTNSTGSISYYVSQTNSFGCEGDDVEIIVTVNPDANASFIPTQTIGCPPFLIDAAIINLQAFPLLNSDYQWYADDVLIGNGTAFPNYTINQQNDSIEIKLITTSIFGCLSDTITHKFFTYKTPVPTFTQDETIGCGPLSVTFTNTTNDIALYNYFWDFGNGTTSTLEQPGTISFDPNPLSGDTIYQVQLTITTSCGDYTVTHPVHVKAKPIALFTPSRTVGCSPMTVTFVNTTRGNNVTYDWDFGNGQTLSTTTNTSVTNTYNTGVVDTFTVRLIATNECGADTSYFDLIVAPNNINLNFQMNGTDQFGCAPHTVPFINNTPGANVFNWDFGDGNILSTTNGNDTVYHTFQNSGTYTITLFAQNACTDTTATRTVTVFQNPEASFNPDRYTVCIGENVLFNNTSDAATSYLWQFGDGTTSTLVNPTHSYAAAGNYTVKLNIYRVNAPGNICVDSVEHQIQVVGILPGSFTSTTVGTCVPMTVTFINDQRPSLSATWDFGDGQTATGDSVVHIYTAAGIYSVTLQTISPGGCTYNATQTVTVNGTSGILIYNAGYVCFPDPARFEVAGTNIQNIEWNFGDGTIRNSNQLVQFYNYTNPGTYIPSVVLQSADGCTFPIRGTDTVKVDKIIAGFSYNSGMFCGYTTLNFTDTSSVFFGKDEVKWDFGDGQTATGISVSHNYTVAGVYTIEMIVISNSGCSDTVTKQITIDIHHLPIVAIQGPTDGCTSESLNFISNVQSIDQVSHFQWNISNGATFTSQNFDYAFLQSGTYTVQLVAGTVNGCFDTAVHTIQIIQSPTVRASPDVTYCIGGNAQLSVVGAVSYQWSPVNDLSCNDCPNPLTTATVSTPYLVTGLAANGCTATDTVNVTVIQPLQMNVSPSDSICIGESSNLMASGAASYTWSPAATLSSNNVSNPVATPTNTTTYRVVGYDGHGCFTDTAFVVIGVGQYPTVSLGPDISLSAGTNHPLVAVVQNGPIEHWEWTPPQDLDCADCPAPTAYIRNDITYSVRVETFYGCTATDEVKIKVFCTDGQVYIPNAFTPDGDGINDLLMVRGTGIARVKTFRIFNRWGEVVFERSNFSPNNPTYGWNGTVRGKIAPPDVFVYTVEVICENGTPYTYKGNVSIIK